MTRESILHKNAETVGLEVDLYDYEQSTATNFENSGRPVVRETVFVETISEVKAADEAWSAWKGLDA